MIYKLRKLNIYSVFIYSLYPVLSLIFDMLFIIIKNPIKMSIEAVIDIFFSSLSNYLVEIFVLNYTFKENNV